MTKIRYVGTEAPRPRAPRPAARRGRSTAGRRKTRSATSRRLRTVVICAAAAGAVIVALAWGVRVRSVRIEGRIAADARQLRQAVTPCFGRRIFLVDRRALRERLLEDPWIENAVILPLPTGVLRVRLKEATPVFSLDGGGAVRADGRVLPPRRGIDVSGLPRLRAPRREGTAELSKVARRLVRELCVALDRTPWTWPSGLSSVEVGADGDVTLTTGGGLVVVLGSEGWDRRLATFAQTLPSLRPRPGDRLDFRFQRQVVVTSGVDHRGG